jgi:hypothetical protein
MFWKYNFLVFFVLFVQILNAQEDWCSSHSDKNCCNANIYCVKNGSILCNSDLNPSQFPPNKTNNGRAYICNEGNWALYFDCISYCWDIYNDTTVCNSTYCLKKNPYDTVYHQRECFFEPINVDLELTKEKINDLTCPGNSDGSIDCFIATAAYGSKSDTNVQILRQFRDKFLIESIIGQRFIHYYYQISPSIARYINENENLRSLTRFLLNPIVNIIQLFI